MTPLDVVHRLTQASTPYDEQAGRIIGALTVQRRLLYNSSSQTLTVLTVLYNSMVHDRRPR